MSAWRDESTCARRGRRAPDSRRHEPHPGTTKRQHGDVAHRLAREPRWHPRVLRLRHLRRLRERHRRRHLPESHASHLPDSVVCRVRRWLSGASPRWHRAQPLRRSLRTSPRVPGFHFRDVRRHIRSGPRTVIRHVGAGRKRADGGAPAHSGILSRWRAARCSDLRGRNRAATRTVCLRCGLLMRHHGGRGGLRGQSCPPNVAAIGGGGHARVAHCIPAGWAGRAAEFRLAAVA